MESSPISIDSDAVNKQDLFLLCTIYEHSWRNQKTSI